MSQIIVSFINDLKISIQHKTEDDGGQEIRKKRKEKKRGLKQQTSPFRFLEEEGKWVCVLLTLFAWLFLKHAYCVSPCVTPNDRAGRVYLFLSLGKTVMTQQAMSLTCSEL